MTTTPPPPYNPENPLRLAVLISGGGSTLANLIQTTTPPDNLPAHIVQVISSRTNVRGNDIARAARIPLTIIRKRDFPDVQSFSNQLTATLDHARPDLVLFAGFLCFYQLPPHYLYRTLNIHPALLPDFGGVGMFGLNVHRAVLSANRAESGCTVHLVDNQYDHGPIVAQRRVPVRPDDTPESLAARVQAAERILYPHVIHQIARHGLDWLRRFAPHPLQ